MRRRLVVFVVSLMLVGCQGGDAPAPTAKVSVRPSASPSPTASPSPAVEFTGERLAAYESVRKYLDALYSWMQSPKSDMGSVTIHAVDDAQIMVAEMMDRKLVSKERVRGFPAYRNWKVGEPRTAPDGIEQIDVFFCMDMTGVAVISAGGKERPLSGTAKESYGLRKMDDGSWRVAEITNEVVAC